MVFEEPLTRSSSSSSSDTPSPSSSESDFNNNDNNNNHNNDTDSDEPQYETYPQPLYQPVAQLHHPQVHQPLAPQVHPQPNEMPTMYDTESDDETNVSIQKSAATHHTRPTLQRFSRDPHFDAPSYR